jgi:dihydrofolate synthase/folylpolyglutamate synthase
MKFFNYQKAVKHLLHDTARTNRFVFDDVAAIEKNFAIMEALGNPQNAHKTIHVAGTSGKGSTVYLIDALLRAHTKRTGMTQSPHVYDIRERIQINGQLISEKGFMYSLSAITDAAQNDGLELSYFESLIAMAFESFERTNIDYQIIETGFGGRLDASNVVTRKDKVCVITRIGLDHVQVLGNTVEKIAAEKAGIIQPGNHAFILDQAATINEVFAKRAAEVGATITWVPQHEDYQHTNDELARTVCEYLARRDGWQFNQTTAAATLQQVFMPGRFEKRHYNDHLAILDGAHNPQKLEAVTSRVLREHKYPATVVLGIGERYDLRTCVEALKPIARRIIATQYSTAAQDMPTKPTPTEDLALLGKELGIEVLQEKNSTNALAKAAEFPEPIIVTGSFYLIGELDKAF